VVYQRQVDAVTERIIGVEALVRWRHPERGYVAPSRFIPIAERTGLIELIGIFVLTTACRDAVAWPVPIKVSVNLSAVQLARTHLADQILATLSETGLRPDRLDLELTESLLLDDDDAATATLARLRAAGAKVSLDDFGTGYSSLSYLNRFAIDKVKIDQSFVRNLMTEPSAAAIIRAVVGLARDIGLRVNVEGVETLEQLRVVQQLGCDEVQGYFHGRPEPAAAIRASLLQQNSPPPVRSAAA
jgi:EAL domain-containing protein (putative c-di-GMP-specific phosphodiesterase class I)